MIRFKRLDHIQICIPNQQEAKARQFYTAILGLREIPKPELLVPNGGLWYQIGDVQLHIGTENLSTPSKRHPAFEVEDLQEAREHLSRQGVIVQDEIPIPGQNRFSFFDPFNNRIELLQRT